jgi:hypothetical protein
MVKSYLRKDANKIASFDLKISPETSPNQFSNFKKKVDLLKIAIDEAEKQFQKKKK